MLNEETVNEGIKSGAEMLVEVLGLKPEEKGFLIDTIGKAADLGEAVGKWLEKRNEALDAKARFYSVMGRTFCRDHFMQEIAIRIVGRFPFDVGSVSRASQVTPPEFAAWLKAQCEAIATAFMGEPEEVPGLEDPHGGAPTEPPPPPAPAPATEATDPPGGAS